MTRQVQRAAALLLASLLVWPLFGMWGLLGMLPLLPIWIAIVLFWPALRSKPDGEDTSFWR